MGTLWLAANLEGLANQIHPEEIDLVVIGPGHRMQDDDNFRWDFLTKAHVICFSDQLYNLPGPSEYSLLARGIRCATQEMEIADLPPLLYSQIEGDLADRQDARGWYTIDFKIARRTFQSPPETEQLQRVIDGAIIRDPHTRKPFATSFQTMDTGLQVAWLPQEFFSIAPWVELLCMNWATGDRTRFPHFGDWTTQRDWMTAEEATLASQITRLDSELRGITAEYSSRIAELREQHATISLQANRGRRRLITTQGDELRDEVAAAFTELGYAVRVLDKELAEGDRKKEDLRIRDPDASDWEALVEVRGHKKSGGQPSDLTRLYGYERQYTEETGNRPDKLIYVVNGQIEIHVPKARQLPFSSDPDLVTAFGEQQGLVIWSLDLYRIFTLPRTAQDLKQIRRSIRDTIGRWPRPGS